MKETKVQSLGWEDPLEEEEMATQWLEQLNICLEKRNFDSYINLTQELTWIVNLSVGAKAIRLLKKKSSCDIELSQWFSTKGNLSFKGHLAKSRDIFDCHNWWGDPAIGI